MPIRMRVHGDASFARCRSMRMHPMHPEDGSRLSRPHCTRQAVGLAETAPLCAWTIHYCSYPNKVALVPVLAVGWSIPYPTSEASQGRVTLPRVTKDGQSCVWLLADFAYTTRGLHLAPCFLRTAKAASIC